MKLLFMYQCGTGWLETPAIQPKRAYVYWIAGTLEEHVEIGYMPDSRRVPIGTNPFEHGS